MHNLGYDVESKDGLPSDAPPAYTTDPPPAPRSGPLPSFAPGIQHHHHQQQQQQQQNPTRVTVIVSNDPIVAEKSIAEAYLLWFPLGLLGFHQFYLRRYGFGVVYLLTLGLCGVGWIVDGFRMPLLVRDANRRALRNAAGGQSGGDDDDDHDRVSLVDAYVLWFPLGLLGSHHYYMRRPGWGVAYTFSGGLFVIGWLVDAVRMPSLVRDANERLARRGTSRGDHDVKRLGDAYAFGVTPIGLFGAHHFYLGRIAFGIYYLLTLGGLGIGWIIDWFRMPWLVERANNPTKYLLGSRHKFVDDAYTLAFPLGILGLHHFYLERPGWGVLYLFTLGLGGIGWLVDLCRLPCLVAATNERIEKEMASKTVLVLPPEQVHDGLYLTGGGALAHTGPAIMRPDDRLSSLGFPNVVNEGSQILQSPYPPPYTQPCATVPPSNPPAYCQQADGNAVKRG